MACCARQRSVLRLPNGKREGFNKRNSENFCRHLAPNARLVDVIPAAIVQASSSRKFLPKNALQVWNPLGRDELSKCSAGGQTDPATRTITTSLSCGCGDRAHKNVQDPRSDSANHPHAGV